METSLNKASTLNLKKEKNASNQYTVEVHEKVLYKTFSRLFDVFVSLIGLIVTLPVIIIFAFLIKIEDNGPAFYKQERLGKDEKRFWVYKLRSMRMDAEKYGMQWTDKDDPRITKVGGFIRKTRIDELPQLINILNGDMKLIGPRPERPELTEEFDQDIPGFKSRLVVKPGLTGWAQVNGGYEVTPKEKLELDIYYIRNKNIWMDIKIILMTIRVVITGDGAR